MNRFFDTTPRDRYVAHCERCHLRMMLDGKDPSKAIEAFDHSFCLGAGNFTVQRVMWRKKVRAKDTCRMAERIYSPRLPDPRPGECSWMCRGSLSPICVCDGCQGAQHGAVQVIDPLAPPANITALAERIQRARPRGDWPGRKST
jgi:hypothetical protein